MIFKSKGSYAVCPFGDCVGCSCLWMGHSTYWWIDRCLWLIPAEMPDLQQNATAPSFLSLWKNRDHAYITYSLLSVIQHFCRA